MLFSFMGFNPLLNPEAEAGANTVDESVETGEEVEETAEPLDEEGVEEQEVAEPAKEDNSRKDDAAFAQMRRDLEAAQRRADELEEALGLWFQGDNKAAQAHAHYEDISLEEAIGNMEQKRSLKQLEAEKADLEEQLQQLQFNNLKASDLKEIETKHPEAGIKDVEDLGEEFFKYHAMGIDAVTAYEAIQLKKGVPPKPIGKAKTGAPAKTGYLSRDEVMAMSSEQRVKNYDLIRKSMAKWPT